ncbi:hypothetical protein BD309DRAFT_950340 [Dichomitus squalens]|uniref:Uncharacterized protein n=1 Tax=Dichomitus squalens TaxID=114155 RepID=A0A4Q9P5Z5_9APHY|nr:hypothetical protein BD309DRAFT_950340 [Dichomitus squalens]TBU64408.1 hypothetical protein BD310DRAFT_914592 [Dichomitus squalens]
MRCRHASESCHLMCNRPHPHLSHPSCRTSASGYDVARAAVRVTSSGLNYTARQGTVHLYCIPPTTQRNPKPSVSAYAPCVADQVVHRAVVCVKLTSSVRVAGSKSSEPLWRPFAWRVLLGPLRQSYPYPHALLCFFKPATCVSLPNLRHWPV